MRGETWRSEDIELLKRLWGEGVTADAIGRQLGGLSRSAVLGKIFRLRLGGAGKPQAGSGGKAPERRHAGKAPAIVPPAKSRRQGKTLFELTNTCCRWPYKRPGGEKYFFCGVPEADLEAGIPYCPRHMKRAYLVPPPLPVRKPWTAIKRATTEERHGSGKRRAQWASEIRRVFGGR
jgi:GcrA cell cycle regulator